MVAIQQDPGAHKVQVTSANSIQGPRQRHEVRTYATIVPSMTPSYNVLCAVLRRAPPMCGQSPRSMGLGQPRAEFHSVRSISIRAALVLFISTFCSSDFELITRRICPWDAMYLSFVLRRSVRLLRGSCRALCGRAMASWLPGALPRVRSRLFQCPQDHGRR